MRILLTGAGGVGEAVLRILNERDPEGKWMEFAVAADYNPERAERLAASLGKDRYAAEKLDAGNSDAVAGLAAKHRCDFIIDAAPPAVTNRVFDAAFEAGCDYLNFGTWSVPNEKDPYNKPYTQWMGEYNFSRSEEWKNRGRTAMIGFGIAPGVVDIFARFCADYLFDSIEEVHVKSGGNLALAEQEIAFSYNVWSILDECLNPNITWERDKSGYSIAGRDGYHLGPPFSGSEHFSFPEGIGPKRLVKVEHEEAVFIPRYLADKGLRSCTTKMAINDTMLNVLQVINSLGLRNMNKINVNGTMISPRDVVAAAAPQPMDTGRMMSGKTCAGIAASGQKNGKDRNIFMYQVLDNREMVKRLNVPAVQAQSGFGAALAVELFASGTWKNNPGVHAPEAFDPVPYLRLMDSCGFSYGITEMDSEYKKAEDRKAFHGIL